jgi:Rod binding domain-containing protein
MDALRSIPPPPPGRAAPRPEPSGPLWDQAVALEAAFLSEMLAHAGLDGAQTAGGPAAGPFGGGEGESQFASFLRQEQAGRMARQGGIGLAESIFRSLSRRVGHDG